MNYLRPQCSTPRPKLTRPMPELLIPRPRPGKVVLRQRHVSRLNITGSWELLFVDDLALKEESEQK